MKIAKLTTENGAAIFVDTEKITHFVEIERSWGSSSLANTEIVLIDKSRVRVREYAHVVLDSIMAAQKGGV